MFILPEQTRKYLYGVLSQNGGLGGGYMISNVYCIEVNSDYDRAVNTVRYGIF